MKIRRLNQAVPPTLRFDANPESLRYSADLSRGSDTTDDGCVETNRVPRVVLERIDEFRQLGKPESVWDNRNLDSVSQLAIAGKIVI